MFGTMDHVDHIYVKFEDESHRPKFSVTRYNKSSTVAEMGDRLVTIGMGKKWGLLSQCFVPFGGGGAGSPSNTLSPGTRPTSVLTGILIHPTVWPQYTNVGDEQVTSKLIKQAGS